MRRSDIQMQGATAKGRLLRWIAGFASRRHAAPVRRRPSRMARRGFSLVEVLVVMAIIGLLMGLVGPRVMSVLGDSKEKTAKMQMQNLGSALEVFYLDTGRYPTSDEGLGALVQRPGTGQGWNGPYLRGSTLPKDPWGGQFSYAAPAPDGAPYEIKATMPGGKTVALNAETGSARQ